MTCLVHSFIGHLSNESPRPGNKNSSWSEYFKIKSDFIGVITTRTNFLLQHITFTPFLSYLLYLNPGVPFQSQLQQERWKTPHTTHPPVRQGTASVRMGAEPSPDRVKEDNTSNHIPRTSLVASVSPKKTKKI